MELTQVRVLSAARRKYASSSGTVKGGRSTHEGLSASLADDVLRSLVDFQLTLRSSTCLRGVTLSFLLRLGSLLSRPGRIA